MQLDMSLAMSVEDLVGTPMWMSVQNTSESR